MSLFVHGVWMLTSGWVMSFVYDQSCENAKNIIHTIFGTLGTVITKEVDDPKVASDTLKTIINMLDTGVDHFCKHQIHNVTLQDDGSVKVAAATTIDTGMNSLDDL